MTPYNLKEQKEPGVKRYSAQPPGFRGNRAFTLVELLIVITIIAMLATMTLLVVGSAQRATRISATETTIARIDAAVCEMYETYSNRRVEVPSGNDSLTTAKMRLARLWDIMRREMPQNWAEVENGWNDSDSPSLQRVYYEELKDAIRPNAQTAPDDPVFYLFNAKLLYQIVMNGNPEAREMFTERGIAMGDDGKPYFVDAWGEPICFIRWAPAFVGSDRQPNMFKWTGYGSKDDDCKNYLEHWQEHISPDTGNHPNVPYARERYPDPLDILGVRTPAPGWFLVPLVFSAGPDREHGIEIPSEAIYDPFQAPSGIPDGVYGYELDNIHNHRLGGR